MKMLTDKEKAWNRVVVKSSLKRALANIEAAEIASAPFIDENLKLIHAACIEIKKALSE